MKTVFYSHSEVCHVYAERSQTEGRAGNIFFYNDKIYSYGYHYCMGQFLDHNTILINNRGYSSSTAKHLSILTSATRQYKQFFTMSCDIDLVLMQVKNNAKKLITAKKPFLYISPSLGLWTSLHEYLNHTKTLNQIKKTSQYSELKKLINMMNKETLKESFIQKEKQRIEKEKQRENERILKQFEKFQKYEINYFRSKTDFLRISRDKNFVETSQAVKIPISEAKRILRLVDIERAIGELIDNKYTITSCNGFFKAGCHVIDRKEIERIRPFLNAL